MGSKIKNYCIKDIPNCEEYEYTEDEDLIYKFTKNGEETTYYEYSGKDFRKCKKCK